MPLLILNWFAGAECAAVQPTPYSAIRRDGQMRLLLTGGHSGLNGRDHVRRTGTGAFALVKMASERDSGVPVAVKIISMSDDAVQAGSAHEKNANTRKARLSYRARLELCSLDLCSLHEPSGGFEHPAAQEALGRVGSACSRRSDQVTPLCALCTTCTLVTRHGSKSPSHRLWTLLATHLPLRTNIRLVRSWALNACVRDV